jgi:hypothetical protein
MRCLAFFAALLLAPACHLVQETPSHHAVHAGEIATLLPHHSGPVWLAADGDTAAQVNRAVETNDAQALERLRAQDKAWPVDRGAQVRVISEHFNDRKVTVVSARDAGKTGWVPYEWLEPVPPSQR